MTDEARKQIDWELVEKHYRAGLLSLREIAKDAGISEGAVRKRAKKDCWERDLAEKIQQRAKELVRKRSVRVPSTQLTPATEKQVVEQNAEAAADVVMRHRSGLTRLGALRDKLLGELEVITDNKELFENLGEMMDESGEDANGRFKQDKRNELYRKVISMTERIDNTKKLAEIDEKLRKGEREAFNLDDGESKESSIDSLLKKINQESGG
jgi:hypothetical protein